MFQTKVTDMLGSKYPIIGGTMARISNAEFVAAMCNAGAVGVLASANYNSRAEFAAAIDKLQNLTDEPFAVNINTKQSLVSGSCFRMRVAAKPSMLPGIMTSIMITAGFSALATCTASSPVPASRIR